jgi:flagellar assembly protein FliH
LSESGRVLNAEDYATASQPYLMEKVAAAAMAELRRKRDLQDKAPGVPEIDPVALRQREEAADLRAQAARLLKDAQAKASALVAEAGIRSSEAAARSKEAAIQEGTAQGTAAGFEAGKKQGSEEGLAQYADLLSRFQALLEGVKAEKEAFFTDREAMLVELATEVAAKVIHREVQTRPDHILNLLRQVARRLADKSKLLVTVHPADLERITRAQAEGLLKIQGLKQIEFLADDKMVVGGVRIASGHQTLDAALDSQLGEISRSLLEEAYHEA